MAVADYCQAMERNEIRVNRDYQRSDKVWPTTARSFLIETILLGFPMPKLALFQVTDLKTRKVSKEIVDGQQRSMAILDFYKGKFRLSRKLDTAELAGKTYAKLTDEYKQQFLDYSLSIDLFVGATLEQVREVFRRMNSYTVPLNPEEHRHAVYQGEFKWFVNRFTRKYSESFARTGIFAEKQLVRMQDTKLIADVVNALVHGIQTTKRTELDKLYKDFDESFADEGKMDKQLSAAFGEILRWKDLHDTPLMKPHQVMMLILALIHMRSSQSKLEAVYHSTGQKTFDSDLAVTRLTQLAEILERDVDEVPSKWSKFAEASASKTNVKETRETRFKAYCWALDPKKK